MTTSVPSWQPSLAISAAPLRVGWNPARSGTLQSGLVIGIATLAAATAVALFTADTTVRVATVGGVLGIAIGMLSGNPRLFCLYCLVLTAPLDLGKRFLAIPHMGGAGALRFDLVEVFMVALLFFQGRDIARGYRSRKDYRIPTVCASWVALILLGGIFVALGPLRRLAVFELLRMLKCLLLFLIVVNEVVRLKQIGHLVVALLCGVMLQAGVGLTQYALGGQLGLKALGEETEENVKATSEGTLEDREQVNRVGALLGHSNLLAAYLALLMPVGVALLFTQVDFRIRLLSGTAVLLGTAVLIATLSRTGWATFGVAVLGVLLLGSVDRRTGGRHALRRFGAVLVLAVVVLAFSGPVLKRLFRSDPWSVRNRLEWIDVATRMVLEKPIFGHGLNTFVYQMAPYTKWGTKQTLFILYGKNLPVVHNNYAIVWAEQGTVGFLFFMALPLHVLYVGIRNLRIRHETLFAINLGCMCGLAVMMLDWLVSFSLRTETVGRVYWMQVGLLCAIDLWWQRNREAPEAASREKNLLVPAASGNV